VLTILLLTPREARGGGGAALKQRGSDVTVGASAGGTFQLEFNRSYPATFAFAGMNRALSQARNGAS